MRQRRGGPDGGAEGRTATWRAVMTALLACALGAGCEPGEPGKRAVVRDSAGITIVENPSPDDSSAWDWWAIDGPVVDIGGVDADEAHALFRVTDAHRRDDGVFVIANGGSAELRVFEADGSYRASWGRRGGGPGEFQSLSAILPAGGDSILAFDARERRFSVFAPDGGLVRDFRLGEAGSAGAIPIDRLDDGGFIAFALRILADPNEIPSGLQRGEAPVIRFTADGAATDTIGVFPGAERVIHVSARNGQIQSIEVTGPPYERTTTHALCGDLVWVGTQDGPDIHGYGLDGTLRTIVRTGRSVGSITQRHIDAWIERGARALPEEGRVRYAEATRDMPHGGVVPAYGRLMCDRSGSLWVADYNDPLLPAGRWTVYDSAGRDLARIALPERFQPYEIGEDWILGREQDDLDIEHVRLYRIVRAAAGASR